MVICDLFFSDLIGVMVAKDKVGHRKPADEWRRCLSGRLRIPDRFNWMSGEKDLSVRLSVTSIGDRWDGQIVALQTRTVYVLLTNIIFSITSRSLLKNILITSHILQGNNHGTV